MKEHCSESENEREQPSKKSNKINNLKINKKKWKKSNVRLGLGSYLFDKYSYSLYIIKYICWQKFLSVFSSRLIQQFPERKKKM